MVKFRLKARSAPLPFPRPEIELDECMPFTYGLITEFAKKMRERNIRPELEIYHPGGHWVIGELLRHELIEAPFLIQTVMGVQTTSYATPQYLLNLLTDLPDQTVWLCSGVGVHQLNIVTMAVLMGGHARVGLEDNVYERRGKLLASNAAAVERIARIARDLNRDIATPAESRAMLGLSATPTRYG
jgi:3-keto-5-aminohexanoate cleavage enzyme